MGELPDPVQNQLPQTSAQRVNKFLFPRKHGSKDLGHLQLQHSEVVEVDFNSFQTLWSNFHYKLCLAGDRK